MEPVVAEQSEVVRDEAGRVPEYVGVDYPGNVVSVDNMLNTLGGMDMISHVYSDPNRRLELRFRPSDAYCKPACATRDSATGLLVRVTRRVRKKKKKQFQEDSPTDPSDSMQSAEQAEAGSATSEKPRESFCSTLLGVVRTSYAFNTLCDFQYLPLVPIQEPTSLAGHEEAQRRTVPVSKISKNGTSSGRPTEAIPLQTPTSTAQASEGEGMLETDEAKTSLPEFHSSTELLPTAKQSSPECPLSPSADSKAENDSLPPDLNHSTDFQSSTDPSEKSEEPISEKGYAHPYECFAPQELVSTDWLRKEPQFLFLPPPAFTRMHTPQAYFFRGEESEASSRAQAVSGSASSKSSDPASSSSSVQKSDACTPSSTTSSSTTAAPATSNANTEPATDVASPSVRTTPNVIYRTRHRRTLFAVLCDFDTATPCEPHPEALKQLHLKFLQRSMSPVYERLKELFEERPIWSRAGIRSALGYSSDNLKYLLPTVGYYFTAGPWRNLWIKFGYDPRKKPESFVYQTFNYRLKQTGLIKSYIDAKRNYSNYLLPYKSNFVSRKKVSVIQSNLLSSSSLNSGSNTNENAKKNSSSSKKQISDSTHPSLSGSKSCKDSTAADDSENANVAEEESERDDGYDGEYALLDPDSEQNAFGDLDEGETPAAESGESSVGDAEKEGSSNATDCLREENYIYRPGCIPPYRQMFYQYCDVLVPEIQQVLENCVLETSERLRCDARYGWLNRRVEDECRSIMGRVVDAAVRKRTEQDREQNSKATTSATSALPADTCS